MQSHQVQVNGTTCYVTYPTTDWLPAASLLASRFLRFLLAIAKSFKVYAS